MSPKGTCKLCGQEKKLIKAHLIPDGFRKHLAENNKFVTIRTDHKYSPVTNKLPTLTYDTNILCRECDGDILGPYDQFLVETIDKIKKTPQKSLPYVDFLPPSIARVKVDTHKFALSLLCSLWRSSISELFDVKLSKKNNQRIKNWLLDGKIDEDFIDEVFISTFGAPDLVDSPGGTILHFHSWKDYNFFWCILCNVEFFIILGDYYINKIGSNNAFHKYRIPLKENTLLEIPLLAKDFKQLLSLDKKAHNKIMSVLPVPQ